MDEPQQTAVDFAAITRIQDRAVAETSAHLAPGSPVIVEAPTGAGKTRINSRNIAEFYTAFVALNGREPLVLALQHRENLLVQNKKAFQRWAPDVSATLGESSGGDFDAAATINFAMVQTAANADLPKIDLLTVDETHHASDSDGADYSKVFAKAFERNPDLCLIATSATLNRPDKRGLHPALSAAKRVSIGYKELERAGQIILPSTKTVDIRTENGTSLTQTMRSKYRPEKDAEAAGLNKALKSAKPQDYNEQMLSAWERHFKDPLDKVGTHAGTIVFESTIASARKFAAEAAERGHSVAFMGSDQDKSLNDTALQDYTDGRIDLLVSVKMIDEGIDVPHTRCVIINRETTSEIEYQQMVGRTMRRGDDPVLQNLRPTVLDGGASTMLHGAVERRAEVLDYIQRLDRGQATQRNEDAKAMPVMGKEYSPWHLHKDPPPVMALTDGDSNIYAVVSKTADGEQRFTLSEAREVKGRSQVTIMKDADNKPLLNIDSDRLLNVMTQRILAKREDILRLEVSESLVHPGRSLAEDRFKDEQASTAVMFAAQMRQSGASR